MAESGGYSCFVPSCRNRSMKNKNLSWHSFPRDPKLKALWISRIKGYKNVNLKVTKYSKLCSEHFTQTDFRPFMVMKRKMLKDNVVPTIFSLNGTECEEECNGQQITSTESLSEIDNTTDKEILNMNQQEVVSSIISDKVSWSTTSVGDGGIDAHKALNSTTIYNEKECELNVIMDFSSINIDEIEYHGETLHSQTLFNSSSETDINVISKELQPHIESSNHCHISGDSGALSFTPLNLKDFEVAHSSNAHVDNEDHWRREISNMAKQILDLEKQIVQLKSQLNQKNFEVNNLTEEKEKWKFKAQDLKDRLLNVSIIKKSPENCTFYTGLPDYDTFEGLLEYLEKKASEMQYWNGKKTKENYTMQNAKRGCKRQLTLEDEFFLVLLRLRLGMPLKELARAFSLSEASISNITTTWIHLLFYELQLLCPFPSKAATDLARPLSFREYPSTRIILDCTEFRVEKPSSISAQRATFSSYKNYNTYKCLIRISPGGMITFVSKLYGGASSDKFIVQDSKVLELIECGDDVMADKGFELDDIMPEGVTLNIPPFFRRSKAPQMPVEDVLKTNSIAKVRVHVERAIRRIKTFHIFDGAIPLSMSDIAEKIVMVCSLLTNFFPDLIKENTDLSLLDDF